MSSTKAATTPISEEAGNKENNPNKGGENSSAVKGPPSAIEFEPPLACVRRILKHSLPSSTNVGKDASAAFARASGIFIIYLTACANDFARENRRQTITANDVLAAIKELEFDEFTPQLTAFLEHYRESEKTKKEAKAKAKEEGSVPMDNEGDAGDDDKFTTPQSMKSKGEETAYASAGENEGDPTDEEDRDGERDEEDDVDDMEE